VTGFDYALFAMIGTSVVLGVMRGLIKELLSLVAFGLAFLAAIWWGPVVSSFGPMLWVSNEYIRHGIAYAALFVLTLLAVGLVNMALAAMIRTTGLTPADRGLGAAFGLLRGVLLILVIVTLAGYTPLPQEPWWKNAMFSKQIVGVVQQIKARVPAPVHEWLPY
jgi:membrane protein required for colicin V production